MQVVRVFTGSDDQSHFEDIDIPFPREDSGGGYPDSSKVVVLSFVKSTAIMTWISTPHRADNLWSICSDLSILPWAMVPCADLALVKSY